MSVKKFIKDLLEFIKFYRSRTYEGLPKHALTPYQVYPQGKAIAQSLEDYSVEYLSAFSDIDNKKVSSIGSCFAEKISRYLLDRGDSYIRLEKSTFDSSADWGRVYTAVHFSQIVQYSLQEDFPVYVEKDEKRGYFDPCREYSTPFYETQAQAIEAIREHRRLSRQVFERSEVLVFTLGQNEVWRHEESGLSWARLPSDKKLFSLKVMSVSENIAYLKTALDLLFAVNPNLKVVLTLSPVASYATFSAEQVITESMKNKAILRVALDEISNSYPKGQVSYFPSYEMVMAQNPYSFQSDNRHVNYRTEKEIFSVLEKTMR